MAPKSQKSGGFSAAYARMADFDITTLFARAPPPKTSRSIYIQQDLPDAFYDIKKNGKHKIKKDHVYNSNQVVTSKYTVFTFVPRNLLEQFRRVANMFFLGIAILQFFPKFSTISPGLVILPLIAVLAITALKDGYEDVKRHQSDRRVNHTQTWRLAGGEWRNSNIMGPKSKTFTAGVPKAFKRTKTSVNPEELSFPDQNGSPADPATGLQHVPLPSDDPPPPLLRSPTQAQAPETYEADPAIPHWESVLWEDVAVGDFILLHNGDPVPADVVICATSEPENIAFIETKNLDGETNLKSRRAVPELTELDTPQNIVKLTRPGPTSFRIDAEAPDVTMYKLNAAVVSNNGDQHPIDIQTVLLRGTVLRNTAWVIGVVMYTGGDTKIVLNSGQTPSKRSKVEREMNPMVFINLALLAAMAMVCAIVDSILEHRGVNKDEYWLYNDNLSVDNPNVNGIVTFANALITFQNVVPISLYISIEFVRTCQAAFIYFDYEMYYVKPGQPPESGQPTLARSWNLSDDLGQIEYVFSDKTGTLTQNSMVFHQCSIGGKVYAGEALVDPKTRSSDSTPPIASRSDSSDSSVQGGMAGVVDPVDSLKIAEQSKDQIPHFFDNQLTDDINGASGPVQSKVINDFFTALALCHTVLAGKDVNGGISYKAQSPDEAALVQAAADVGYVFLGRKPSTQILRLQTPRSPEPESYELLNILDFTSARKRMSVILRRLSDRQLLLICKGADQVIFDRLAPGAGEQYKDKTGKDLDLFATEGLRTLCLAHKTLSEEEYIAWDARYRQATTQLQNRDEHIEIVSSEIETNLYVLGATAIEDKLQDGVPETIADLKRAGIKIWVATGDKPETAVAIGYTTNLISRQANLIPVRGESATQRSAYSQMSAAVERYFPQSGLLKNEDVLPLKTGEGLTGGNTNRLARAFTGIADIVGTENGQRPGGFVLVIDGLGLEQVFQEAYSKDLFLQLATRCEAVICCRVSPLQKALIVHLVKDGLGVMTLAIGDGANDVSMIQAADVGIGISGEEGLQAVNASDYAIGQFRYLKRLLLVHGQWSYARNANMIVNFFYKNILGIGVLWWFQIYCGWSTTYVFEYTYLLFWNVFWSLAPVIAIGIFDRNIDDVVLMALPELYNYGRRQEWFGNIIFIIYMLEGAYQSAVIFFLGMFSYMTTTTRTDGYDVYMYEFSTTMVIASVMVVNAFHGISTSAWTGWVIFAISIGVVLVWVYTAVYSIFPPAIFAVPVYGNDHYLFRSAYYWFGIILMFFVAMLPRYISKAYRVTYYPNDIDILRIVHKVDPHRDIEHDPLIGGRFTEDGVLRPLDPDLFERAEPHSHPLQRRGTHPHRSPTSLPAGTRMEMSTGLELAPSRGFDFSTEEGGVEIRRIQTGLSERNGKMSVPTPPQKRSIRLFPSRIRRSILKSPKVQRNSAEES